MSQDNQGDSYLMKEDGNNELDQGKEMEEEEKRFKYSTFEDPNVLIENERH